jgi:hypothetical protein
MFGISKKELDVIKDEMTDNIIKEFGLRKTLVGAFTTFHQNINVADNFKRVDDDMTHLYDLAKLIRSDLNDKIDSKFNALYEYLGIEEKILEATPSKTVLQKKEKTVLNTDNGTKCNCRSNSKKS